MKALIQEKAQLVATKLRDVKQSAAVRVEKHQWIMPAQYPTFDKERPGLVLLTK